MPTTAHCPERYKQHDLDKGDDRADLFLKLARRYDLHSALYPGSFVDISLRQTGKGVSYTRRASSYVFRRTG